MKAKTVLDRIRLLPVLIGVCGILLPLKLVSVAAFAESSAPAKPAQTSAAAPAQAPQPSETGDMDDNSSAEVDVLTSLSKRRTELDHRASELDMRENLITAAEKRIDGKIAALKDLEQTIHKLLAARDEAQQKEIAALVKTYSAMKPRDAARIFDGLDEDVLIPVASAMKPDALAPILAQMQADAARKVTMKLADRLQLPKAATQPALASANTQSAVQPAAQSAALAAPGG